PDPDPDPVFDPRVVLAPSTVSVSDLAGTGVIARLAGFLAEAEVTVSAAGVDTRVTTDSDGAAMVSLVRTATVGELAVTATDGTNTASAVLTVTANSGSDPDPDPDPRALVVLLPVIITADDFSRMGTEVRVHGFDPNSTVNVVVVNGDAATRISTDENGEGVGRLFGPSTAHGSYEVIVSDANHLYSAELVVVREVRPGPHVEIPIAPMRAATLGSSGVPVTGIGFPAGAAARILFDGTEMGTVTVSEAGAVSHRLVVPGVAPGIHTITVTSVVVLPEGGGRMAVNAETFTASVEIEVLADATPTPEPSPSPEP
ncbi:MAG: hypothetical protein Q4G64_06305, partial [bacterium]|nr:hypothetical protein [bacterium]